jgi:hypothetical protein
MARPASPDPVAVGAYEYYEAPVFNPMSDGRPINLTESQAITTNPYTILVYPTGAAGINRVEFFIDGILIGVDYEPDANGLYSCDWNTELYHSLVRVVAFDNQGQAVELSRNATVMLEMPFTGK